MIVNEGGKKLPKLTTPGTSADLLTGKQLIDQYGNVVDGRIPIVPGSTITPGVFQKTAIQSGRYASGNITISGDSSLISENILKGKSIFGVEGSVPDYDVLTGGFQLRVTSSGIGSISACLMFDSSIYPEKYVPKSYDDLGSFVLLYVSHYSMYGGEPYQPIMIYKTASNGIRIALETGAYDQEAAVDRFVYSSSLIDGKIWRTLSIYITDDRIEYPYGEAISGVYIPKF